MKPKAIIQGLIVIFPMGLIAMVVVGLLLHEQRRVDKQEENPMGQRVSEKAMMAHYTKLKDFMTPREFASPVGQQNLVRVSAFIEGSLSPMNTGKIVESENALTTHGRIWKQYSIVYEGKSKKDSVNYTFNYQSGDNVELAVALMIAEVLPDKELENTVTLTFAPEGGENEITQWAKEAKLRGEGMSLSYDGVDWVYLNDQVVSLVEQLSR